LDPQVLGGRACIRGMRITVALSACAVTMDAAKSVTATFTLSTTSYTLTADPSAVPTGGTITVSWTAPAGSSASDWIGLYPIGAPNTRYLAYRYTNGAPSGSVTFTAPATLGTYEFRYLLKACYTSVAASNPVTVTAQTAALTVTNDE
jgi:hypothetical protein